MSCSCCGAPGRTKKGCSCTGGGSHMCLKQKQSGCLSVPSTTSTSTSACAYDLLDLLSPHPLPTIPEPVEGISSTEQLKQSLDKQSEPKWLLCIRTFGRPSELKSKTLAVLEKALKEEDLQRCFIFLSATVTPTSFTTVFELVYGCIQFLKTG